MIGALAFLTIFGRGRRPDPSQQPWFPVVGAAIGAIVAIAAIAAGVGVLLLGRRRLGGYTGDVLGAAGVVLETVGLVALAAR